MSSSLPSSFPCKAELLRPCQGHHATPAKETVPQSLWCGCTRSQYCSCCRIHFGPHLRAHALLSCISTRKDAFFFPAARTAKREESDCFSGQLHGCVGENRNAARERERGTDLIRGIQLFARFCERKKVDLFGEDAILGEFLSSGGGCGISSAMGKRKNLHGVEKDGLKSENVSEPEPSTR
jgi:hypothetical protein